MLLGDLPNDFLRLGSPSTSSQQQQLTMDEEAARTLQQQLYANSAAVQQQHPHLGAVPPGAVYAPGFYGGFTPPNTKGRLSITIHSVS